METYAKFVTLTSITVMLAFAAAAAMLTVQQVNAKPVPCNGCSITGSGKGVLTIKSKLDGVPCQNCAADISFNALKDNAGVIGKITISYGGSGVLQGDITAGEITGKYYTLRGFFPIFCPSCAPTLPIIMNGEIGENVKINLVAGDGSKGNFIGDVVLTS